MALWESYDPFAERTTLSFSELRESVWAVDSGQFNYHLDRLTGHFVDSTDEEYELSDAGLKLVRSVVAGAGIEDPRPEPTEVGKDPKRCGTVVEVSYEDGWLYLLCRECDGLWKNIGDHPEGHLAKFSLHPAGLTNRTADEIYAAAWVSSVQKLYSMLDGVCPTCSGPVERSLKVCEDHDSEGLCPNCERDVEVAARLRCPVCKGGVQTTLGSVAKYHSAVVGFYHERGIELQYGFDDLERIDRRLERAGSNVEAVSADPPRVEVATEIDGDARRVTIDGVLAVVGVGPR